MVSQVGYDGFKKLLTQTLPNPRFKIEFQPINPQKPIHGVGLGLVSFVRLLGLMHTPFFFFERDNYNMLLTPQLEPFLP